MNLLQESENKFDQHKPNEHHEDNSHVHRDIDHHSMGYNHPAFDHHRRHCEKTSNGWLTGLEIVGAVGFLTAFVGAEIFPKNKSSDTTVSSAADTQNTQQTTALG